MEITPTAEFMDVTGRLQAKGCDLTTDQYFREYELMRRNGDSICARLADDEAKHRAVAARYPHLYVQESHAA
jgi:hypothetical protein